MLPAQRSRAEGGADLSKKTVAELKELCESYGLRKGGNKGELLLRLRDHKDTPAPSAMNTSQTLSVSAGPWLKRCVKRWKLAAPYDTAVGRFAVMGWAEHERRSN